jgi:hypothetical protein
MDGAAVCDLRLTIATAPQSIRVEGRTGRIGTEPESNASAVVMGERQIAALSDDPDELALELQALAGPAPGPDGGQVYIDGFRDPIEQPLVAYFCALHRPDRGSGARVWRRSQYCSAFARRQRRHPSASGLSSTEARGLPA